MKTIESLELTELTQNESASISGGFEPLTIVSVSIAVMTGAIGCFMLGYTIGKAIF